MTYLKLVDVVLKAFLTAEFKMFMLTSFPSSHRNYPDSIFGVSESCHKSPKKLIQSYIQF